MWHHRIKLSVLRSIVTRSSSLQREKHSWKKKTFSWKIAIVVAKTEKALGVSRDKESLFVGKVRCRQGSYSLTRRRPRDVIWRWHPQYVNTTTAKLNNFNTFRQLPPFDFIMENLTQYALHRKKIIKNIESLKLITTLRVRRAVIDERKPTLSLSRSNSYQPRDTSNSIYFDILHIKRKAARWQSCNYVIARHIFERNCTIFPSRPLIYTQKNALEREISRKPTSSNNYLARFTATKLVARGGQRRKSLKQILFELSTFLRWTFFFVYVQRHENLQNRPVTWREREREREPKSIFLSILLDFLFRSSVSSAWESFA